MQKKDFPEKKAKSKEKFYQRGIPMSDIRLLTEEDYEEAFRLSEYAFQYQLTEEQKEFRKQWMSEQDILGDYENGQLTAKTHLLPFTVFIHGQEFNMFTEKSPTSKRDVGGRGS
jgi:hypothetical protein